MDLIYPRVFTFGDFYSINSVTEDFSFLRIGRTFLPICLIDAVNCLTMGKPFKFQLFNQAAT